MLRVPFAGDSKAAAPTPPASASAPAAIAAATGSPEEGDLYTVKLTKGLRTHAGMVHSIKLRKPQAIDYIEIGRVPFDVRGEGENRRPMIDFKVMGEWASRLSGIDALILGTMEGSDFLDMASRINAILMQVGLSSMGNSGGSAPI